MTKRFKKIKFRIFNTDNGCYICNEKLNIINFNTVNEAAAYMDLHHFSRDIF